MRLFIIEKHSILKEEVKEGGRERRKEKERERLREKGREREKRGEGQGEAQLEGFCFHPASRTGPGAATPGYSTGISDFLLSFLGPPRSTTLEAS